MLDNARPTAEPVPVPVPVDDDAVRTAGHGAADDTADHTADPAADPTELGPSEYADQMPLLQRYAALPADDPERERIREQLVLSFLPVVEHLARRYGNGYRVAAYDDLVQTGTVGLITAIDRWDPERAKGEFLGYLIPCVRGEILRYFRDRTWSMRVPRRLKDLGVAIGKASGPLTQELGRAPRPSELAAHLGVDREEVIEALAAAADRRATPLFPVTHDDDAPEERVGTVEKAYDHVEYAIALKPLIEQLPERERLILTLRFFGDQTQSQIAARVGVSQMHVSRLLARTLERLREGLAATNDDLAST